MTYTVLAIREPKNGSKDLVWVDFDYVRDKDNVVHMPESKLCPVAQVNAIGLQPGDKVAL
jgi:hypothetical protein